MPIIHPIIHLTNAASRKPPHRGPGRVWTIMAAPRVAYGEAGEGYVPLLIPQLRWVQGVKSGDLTFEAYQELYEDALWASHRWRGLGPGGLQAIPSGSVSEQQRMLGKRPVEFMPVADGDTLLCCCARSSADRGECHRVWAAHVLAKVGWNVVLDGVVVPSPSA